MRILGYRDVGDAKRPLRAFPVRPQAVFKMPSVWCCRSERVGWGWKGGLRPSERYFYFSDGLCYSLPCSMAANFSGSLRTRCAV